MAHGDFVSDCDCSLIDQVDITIQAHTVGSGDDVEMNGHWWAV